MFPSTAQRDTDQIGFTHTVLLACDCKTCAQNARTIGKPLPLVAYVTERYAAELGITAKNATSARKVHATVALANHPVLGKAQRAAVAG